MLNQNIPALFGLPITTNNLEWMAAAGICGIAWTAAFCAWSLEGLINKMEMRARIYLALMLYE